MEGVLLVIMGIRDGFEVERTGSIRGGFGQKSSDFCIERCHGVAKRCLNLLQISLKN